MGSPTYEGFHAYTQHVDYVTISTGKRSNFIFDTDLVGGAVRLTFNKSTATSYTLRNYDGFVLATGAVSGTTLDIPDSTLSWRGGGPYGWYRLYLFGPDRSDGQWGTAYGDCTFYRVKDSSLFPANPSTAVTTTTAGYDEIARGVMGLGPLRIDSSISAFMDWNVKYAAASGTSVNFTQGPLGGGVLQILVHVFNGDPSELATPTTSNDPVPWVLKVRTTHGNGTLTVSVWEGRIEQGDPSNPQVTTLSSGSKSGQHYVYDITIYNQTQVTRTALTASGTGTTASGTVVAQGFPSNVQKMVLGIVATSTGVTFGSWPSGFATNAFDLITTSTQPAAPNSRFSIGSDVFDVDTDVGLSISWDASCDWVLVGWPIRSTTLSLTSQYNSATLGDTWYTNYSLANRPARKSLVMYAGGIKRRTNLMAGQLANFPDTVAYSAYNEPSLTRPMDSYVENELAPLYNAVKAIDPAATVVGWCNISINSTNYLIWEAFVAAGGLDYCDDLDIHVYNAINGDISLGRRYLQWWNDAVDDAGFTGELWQTEQGAAWLHMGQVYPRYSGRWTALLFMLCELYRIPIERNHYWYDKSMGFDAHPTYWLTNSGPGPQGLLIRTMVDCIGPRALSAQLDFGSAVNFYAGGTWVGSDGSKTVGFMGGSVGLPSVRFTTDAAALDVVDAWGNVRTVTAVDGHVTVTSSELPQWIEVPSGKTCALVPEDWQWGLNKSITATPSTTIASSNVPVSRAVDGTFQNQYGNSTSSFTDAAAPWSDASSVSTLPASLRVDYAQIVLIDRIVIDCAPPWQGLTAPLDFTVDVLGTDGNWTEVYSYDPPTLTSFYFTSNGRCRAETYWDMRSTWIIELPAPVQGRAVRLNVSQVSEGMHESSIWINNGQAGTPRLTIREFQTYGDVKPTVLLCR